MITIRITQGNLRNGDRQVAYADRRRWNLKYKSSGFRSGATDEVVVRYAPIPSDGSFIALDIACGRGHNGLFLAGIGYHVCAADISDVLLENLRGYGNLMPVMMDFDQPGFGTDSFDLIIVLRYLNRELFSPLVSWLRPGGRLIYQTFNYNHLRENPGFNADYVLQPGELGEDFAKLEFVASNDGSIVDTQTWWVGDRI